MIYQYFLFFNFHERIFVQFKILHQKMNEFVTFIILTLDQPLKMFNKLLITIYSYELFQFFHKF